MSNSLIKADAVSKSFSGPNILDRVSISLTAGEIVTVIGPNGSGKTTLIKLLLGLEQPDSGSITRKDGIKIGYVPQTLVINRVLPLDVAWF